MIKILHSGDWHLDSPMQMDTEAKTRLLRAALARIPEKVAAICKAEQCDQCAEDDSGQRFHERFLLYDNSLSRGQAFSCDQIGQSRIFVPNAR